MKDVVKLATAPITAITGALEPPAPPAPAEPVAMPTGDEAEGRKARRRSLAAQRARTGRAATILTQGETLG